jgi:hypothetical protein
MSPQKNALPSREERPKAAFLYDIDRLCGLLKCGSDTVAEVCLAVNPRSQLNVRLSWSVASPVMRLGGIGHLLAAICLRCLIMRCPSRSPFLVGTKLKSRSGADTNRSARRIKQFQECSMGRRLV